MGILIIQPSTDQFFPDISGLASVYSLLNCQMYFYQAHHLWISIVTTINELRHEKTCFWGLRPGKTQTGMLNYRD